MSEKKDNLRRIKVKKKKTNPYKLGFNWFFWICFIIICIPVGYFIFLLFQASQESSTPIIGSRIENAISTEITQAQLESVSSSVNRVDDVEDAEVTLSVATLRIMVDAKDNLEEEQYTKICDDLYNAVDAVLPVSQYFTTTEEYKEYDLEITLYDSLDKEEPMIMILYKNGAMETYAIDNTSKPKDEELAKELTEPEEEEESSESDESGTN